MFGQGTGRREADLVHSKRRDRVFTVSAPEVWLLDLTLTRRLQMIVQGGDMHILRFKCTPILCAFLLTFSAGSLAAAELAFRVVGIEAERGGTINAGLYSSEEGFPDSENAIAGLILSIDGPVVEGRFPDLPPGQYVVAILHDENGDNVMQTRGVFGLPSEGYGFSGTDKARLRPPDFSQAATMLETGRVTVEIILRYP